MSSDDDDFVSYGNALDPIDEDSIPRKKPITAEDQYAKDERGRRRFHGAFTGGFSAGFFNSVGSMEGWKPTGFISSRTNRTRSKDQTIFDYMDDEDTGEYGICPMSLQVKPTFDVKSSSAAAGQSNSDKRRRVAASDLHHVLDASFVQEMLAPSRDTVGVKLLVKMGWRPGQGVGPRLSKREKTQRKRKLRQRQPKTVKKVYGCRLPADISSSSTAAATTDDDLHESSKGGGESESGSETELDCDLDNITFAPSDYQAYVVNPKQNAFGLGYQGIDRKPVLSSKRAEFSVLTVAGKSIKGQAFGVSVFEDDDDDIYGTEDLSNYDFSLPYVGEPKNVSKKAAVSKNTNCIEGFHLSATNATITRKPFVLPVIPANFQPVRVKKNRWDCATTTSNIVKTKISCAPERSKVLQLQDDDEKVCQNTRIEISDIPLPDQERPAPNKSDKITSTTATVAPAPASASGFMKPFSYDAEKQNRYEKFLALKNVAHSSAKQELWEEMSGMYPATMTEWEKEREKSEFEQAARLFRPLAEDLDCRFTRGSQKENVHDISAPVEKSYDAESQALRNAAKNRMFGSLTRNKLLWKPDKVVCKRFNIPEPFVDASCSESSSSLIPQNRKGGSLFEFLKMSTNRPCVGDIETPSLPKPTSSSTSQPVTVEPEPENHVIAEQSLPQVKEEANIAVIDEDPENQTLIDNTSITDKIDLFKAIFLSSSDDDDDDDDDDDGSDNGDDASDRLNKRDSQTTSNSKSTPEKKIHTETSEISSPIPRYADKKEIRYSPARGIFANLDLESLKCRPSFRKNERTESTNDSRSSERTIKSDADTAALYGPKIPSSLLTGAVASSSVSLAGKIQSPKSQHSSSSSMWVEKSNKHSRKDKKHKKHHKKPKKHKHRKEK
ncbi:G patch domain-containing protein 1 homolog [Planococcus citri]|uniref:G patch domain-containing protein 1 homolog n=1 Tax=Planococcus citri TaxID=170843 RepID=UPI0031F99089